MIRWSRVRAADPPTPARAASTRAQMARRDSGSIPAVGSSSSTKAGSPTIATATDSLRFCPPLSVPARALSFGVRPTCSTRRELRSGNWSQGCGKQQTCSSQRRPSERILPGWGQGLDWGEGEGWG